MKKRRKETTIIDAFKSTTLTMQCNDDGNAENIKVLTIKIQFQIYDISARIMRD